MVQLQKMGAIVRAKRPAEKNMMVLIRLYLASRFCGRSFLSSMVN